MPPPTAPRGFFFFFSKSCQDLFILWIRPDPIHPGPERWRGGGPAAAPAPGKPAPSAATCREEPRGAPQPPGCRPRAKWRACRHPWSCHSPTYRSRLAREKARAPCDSVLRPGRKVCAIRGGRRGEGGGAGRRGGAARSVRAPPARPAAVRLRSPRLPRSRSLRPAPGALRLQPRRAPAAAAARPPATLPLPLNSCAKYAALHLRGSRAAPASSRVPPRAPSAPRTAASPRRATCALRPAPATLAAPARRGPGSPTHPLNPS